MTSPKMRFHVETSRLDAHGSVSRCKRAQIALDTDLAGNPDAFNPAELLLAALSACIVKGIERIVPILQFELRGVEVRVDGVRQDAPPKRESITTRSLSTPMNQIAVWSCCTTTSRSSVQCSTL